jgi:hypothetical protein
LRQALRLTVPQAARYLTVRPEVVEALETGQVEYLPAWPETSAIIMTYTSMAGVNGRPVLNAIGTLFRQLAVPAAPQAAPMPHAEAFPLGGSVQRHRATGYTNNAVAQQNYATTPQYQVPQRRIGPGNPVNARVARIEPGRAGNEPDVARFGLAVSSRNLLRAGSAIANGARRLPQEALDQVRRRPQRALYAVSLPLGLLMILLHSAVFATISEPFAMVVQWGSTYFQEHYGPVKDGMRYIEVDDPRTRRADKLRIGGGSY